MAALAHPGRHGCRGAVRARGHPSMTAEGDGGRASPTGTPLLIAGLGVRYPGRRQHSLEGIDLQIARGERVGVDGRTGAGKSTLALAAAGFIPRVVRARLDGRVVIEGADAAAASPGALLGQ